MNMYVVRSRRRGDGPDADRRYFVIAPDEAAAKATASQQEPDLGCTSFEITKEVTASFTGPTRVIGYAGKTTFLD